MTIENVPVPTYIPCSDRKYRFRVLISNKPCSDNYEHIKKKKKISHIDRVVLKGQSHTEFIEKFVRTVKVIVDRD